MRRLFLLLLCLCGMGASTAHAEPITIFTDRAAWEAAVKNMTTIDFEGVPTGSSEMLVSPHTDSGVIFSVDPGTTLSVVDPACCHIGPSDLLVVRADSLPHLSIEPPSGTFAFGFDYGTDLDGFFEATIDFPAAQASLLFLTPSRRTFDFLGVISEMPILHIDTVVLADGTGMLDVDNVSFGDVRRDEAPEPGMIALLGAGAAGAAWRRRRRSA